MPLPLPTPAPGDQWGAQLNDAIDDRYNILLGDIRSISSISEMPTKLCGEYWPKYQNTVALSDIPSTVNLVYLFQAGPLAADASTYPTGSGAVALIGEGGDTHDQTTWLSQVQALRNRGTSVMLTIGGSGAYVDLSTQAKAQACLTSIQNIYTAIGGFDGVDFNLETTENGLSVYPNNMVWLAQQLRVAYGPKFGFSIPVASHITSTYINHDISIVQAMNAAGVLDLVAPQVYDVFTPASGQPPLTEAQKITLVNTVLNFWAPYVNNNWSKLGVGFKTVGTTTSAMSVESAYVAYNILATEHPEIRGAFHFNAEDDFNQSWAWADAVAPRIAQTVSTVTPIPPIALVDDFTTTTGKWTLSGDATVTGGHLTLVPTGYGTGPNYAQSVSTYNITQAFAQFKIYAPPVAVGTLSGGVTIYEAQLSMSLQDPSDVNKYVTATIFAGQTLTDLQVTYRNGTTDVVHSNYNLGYNTTDKYYKFYVQNGYLLLDTAPDVNGFPGVWTTKWLGALSDLPALTAMKIRMSSDGYGTGATIDDFGAVSTSTSTTSPVSSTLDTLTVTGNASVGALTVTNNASVGGSLTLSGNASIAGNLTVTGSVTSSSSSLWAIATKTTSYTATSGDRVLIANGSSVTITLPASSAGQVYFVKNINTSAATLTASAGTIDGSASISLVQYQAITLISDGTNWNIL